jgi:hypothetical protein
METDNQLRDAISKYESRAQLGAVAVVAGLLLEAILAYIFPVGPSPIENWGPVVGDVLIALGVIAEIYFAHKASAQHHELQRRTDRYLAEANARTETERLARVRIEKELAPRYLSAEQYGRIAEKIRPFAGTPFSLGADLTAEPMFVNMIGALLSLAGRWELRHSAYPDESEEGPQLGQALDVTGIAILYNYQSPKKDEWHPAARALDAALNEEGIPCAISPAQPWLADIIHVVVGRKPAFIRTPQDTAGSSSK